MIEAVAIAGLVLAILGLTQARQATTLLRQVQVVCKVQAQKIRTLELRQSESRLNRVWITPEERTKIRGSGEYLTDVLTGLLNRQGAAMTPQMEIAAKYAAARIRQLHDSRSLDVECVNDKRTGGRIEQVADRCWNKPVVRDTRASVADILDEIGEGATVQEIRETLNITADDITGAVGYAVAALEADESGHARNADGRR